MENLIFSLNATVPIFLMMLLGLVFRKLGWIDDVFASKMNKFVFLVPLPVLVFEDLAVVDFKEAWDTKFVLFCFVATLLSIGIAAAVSFLWRDRAIRGEFIQASYRSSAALLGIAFIQNIYGNAGMAPLMIIGSVPLYNIMAVVVLSFFAPERRKLDREVWIRTLKGIVTNPIIIGIVAGVVVYIVDSGLYENLLTNLLGKLALANVFTDITSNSIVDVTGIVFYLSIIVVFVFLTVQSIQKRRWS